MSLINSQKLIDTKNKNIYKEEIFADLKKKKFDKRKHSVTFQGSILNSDSKWIIPIKLSIID